MPASVQKLQQMAIYLGIVGGAASAVMYYLMQKNFAKSQYFQLAVEKLKVHEMAMDSLGAPPLKIHNIRLTDRHNHVDKERAKLKIPVSGARSAGYLYSFSTRDAILDRWHLEEALLQLKDGTSFVLFNEKEEIEADRAESGDHIFNN
ncbi:cytochrome c oxidase assembly factor 1 homolog isoform X2 [Erpetoichthys calabaricus]|nr:cytochrome c oxidase assembly factor 1 homolog isoform X2 [Erpetoichthys calabaricus]